jgi:hypothetical protein
MFRFTLSFYLIPLIFFAQENEEIVGKEKQVKQKIIYLINQPKEKDSDFSFAYLYAEYGEFGINDPKFEIMQFNKNWRQSISTRYQNFVANYDLKGKIKNETWYFSDKSVARKFEYLYNEKDSLIQFKKIKNNGRYITYNRSFNYDEKLNSEFFLKSNEPNYTNINFYKYDSNNNIIKIEKYYSEVGYENSTIYKYNKSNKQILESRHIPKIFFKNENNSISPKNDSIGTTYIIKKKIYDNLNNLIEEQFFTSGEYLETNKIRNRIQFKYDSKNNLIEKNYADADSVTINRTEQYFYNDKKQLIREIRLNKSTYKNTDDARDYEERNYFYDNERLIKLIYKNNVETKTITFAYKFDKRGNWIKQTKSVDGKPLYIWKRKIEYYKE